MRKATSCAFRNVLRSVPRGHRYPESSACRCRTGGKLSKRQRVGFLRLAWSAYQTHCRTCRLRARRCTRGEYPSSWCLLKEFEDAGSRRNISKRTMKPVRSSDVRSWERLTLVNRNHGTLCLEWVKLSRGQAVFFVTDRESFR